jgi:hemerythrin-like domain-containing protein
MVPMKLLDDLVLEHVLIEKALGSLRTYAEQLGRGAAGTEDGFTFLDFLEQFAGDWHHEKEERLLFPALAAEAMLPVDRGPIPVLLEQHQAFAATLTGMRAALSAGDYAEFKERVIGYTADLWLHIDLENSVLIPESERQLRRNGVMELPELEMPAAAAAAAAAARILLARYPRGDEADAVRGEGCVICPSYYESCRGIEREWWNEWEWEELEEHVAAS